METDGLSFIHEHTGVNFNIERPRPRTGTAVLDVRAQTASAPSVGNLERCIIPLRERSVVQ